MFEERIITPATVANALLETQLKEAENSNWNALSTKEASVKFAVIASVKPLWTFTTEIQKKKNFLFANTDRAN